MKNEVNGNSICMFFIGFALFLTAKPAFYVDEILLPQQTKTPSGTHLPILRSLSNISSEPKLSQIEKTAVR